MRPPRERKPFDENTAYRRIFLDNPAFYKRVIETEEPRRQGFEFKMIVVASEQSNAPIFDQTFELEFT